MNIKASNFHSRVMRYRCTHPSGYVHFDFVAEVRSR